MAKRTFLERISDLTRIAHRANFSSVDKHISNLNFETRFSDMVSARYTCRAFTDSEKSGSPNMMCARATPAKAPRICTKT